MSSLCALAYYRVRRILFRILLCAYAIYQALPLYGTM